MLLRRTEAEGSGRRGDRSRIVSIPVPEDLEHVLKPVLERDPAKGTEWLRAGFEARLADLYQQW